MRLFSSFRELGVGQEAGCRKFHFPQAVIKHPNKDQAWWCTSLSPARPRWKQVDLQFKVNLVCLVNSSTARANGETQFQNRNETTQMQFDRLYLTHNSRLKSSIKGTLRRQKLEAASHIASMVKSRR